MARCGTSKPLLPADHTVRDGLGASIAPVACHLLDLANLEGAPRC